MTRVRTAFTSTFLVLALSVVPLSAQYIEMYKLDNRVKDLPEQDVLNTLSTHLGVPVETLKQQKAEYKSGVGELYMANQLAKVTRSDVKSVMSEFRSGKSWGVLAKEKKIDMDQFSKDARQLDEAFKKTERASR